MGRKKKKKYKYDPFSSLRPMALNGDVEPLAKDLYELACCGSRRIWPEIETLDDAWQDIQLRRRFLTASHEGMREAQNRIIEFVKSGKGITASHEILFRGIADTIAWQLIGIQLCYARRLYKGHPQPDLSHSNFESVILASENWMNERPGSIALISDLTSFIQVGDLLTLGPQDGLGIIEVKEGEKNRIIGEFMEFYMQHGCDRSLFYFAQQEGQDSIKQMARILRQAERMAHVSEVMSKGTSIDPDTQEQVRVPDEFIVVDSWDEELNHILVESENKGWAIEVIDSCLFLGCYTEEPMKKGAHVIFNNWFDNCGGTPSCPRSRLLDGMRHPLALPVFNLHIPQDAKFDILFGRKQVCMGFNVESFLNECANKGLQVRFATKKEASQLNQTVNHPYRHKGKVVFIGNGKKEMALMDGIFLRAMFHTQRPIALINAILDSHDD